MLKMDEIGVTYFFTEVIKKVKTGKRISAFIRTLYTKDGKL